MAPHHGANGVGIGAITDRAQRLGCTSLHDRLRVVECLQQRRPRRGIGKQAKRERRHLPHFELFVCQQTRQRLDRRGESDPPERPARLDAGRALQNRRAGE